MKKFLCGFFLLLITASLQSDESNDSKVGCKEEEELQAASPCYPARVYALRRYESEGEVRPTDTSWAGKREDDFYDSLTH
ncbi:hypothetical protein [Parachlamydia sp. AcF125]|uniref:hypothetical protein n=1 Tax=Parachlamydia sp. AcF125 TaxID=2795736 RepID=UPI001BC9E641|nr:hypothetical protein [Parachlamydia sp. AcF125]MBS4167613.1 hypothetical protein [Parachlamydia sp. AcF125]